MAYAALVGSVDTIPLANLALAFIPVLVVVAVLQRWRLNSRTTCYAVGRMLAQLALVGYVLTYIFESERGLVVMGVLTMMLLVASWIALRPVGEKRTAWYLKALSAIALGGGLTLLLVTQGVLCLKPWFLPRVMIPLAGMIFANAMNSVSLAAERFEAETANGVAYDAARRAALSTSLLPIINTLFAVGLVSIPGMMTGQILAGEDPLVAARYQIMVMCMVFGSAGMSSACFLALLRPKAEESAG